jgi:hypothetical protein
MGAQAVSRTARSDVARIRVVKMEWICMTISFVRFGRDDSRLLYARLSATDAHPLVQKARKAIEISESPAHHAHRHADSLGYNPRILE